LNALGHEIHVSRFILFDLLQKNLIDPKSIIVTMLNERFFLYEKYFDNVISYEDYVMNKIDGIEEMDLTEYSTFSRTDQIDAFKKINYHYDQFIKTDFFVNCMSNVHFQDLTQTRITNDKFILIHNRTKITGRENKNIESFVKILGRIKSLENVNIVVFSSDALNINIENVYITNNLNVYCSYLNHKNCKLFISEWSGGGQLSQYFYNGKILYYFDNYPSHDYEKNYLSFQELANKNTNVRESWDFKTVTNCERFYYKTLDDMLDDLVEFI